MVTPRGNRIDKKYLYRMLSNRAYIGEAVHKGESYPGEHDAIIDRETWDKVHTILQESPRKRSNNRRLALSKKCHWPAGGGQWWPIPLTLAAGIALAASGWLTPLMERVTFLLGQ